MASNIKGISTTEYGKIYITIFTSLSSNVVSIGLDNLVDKDTANFVM